MLKTTGHEKSKVTVTLATRENGDKLKPYIVFPGHKRKVQNLFQKFKKDPVIENRSCNRKSLLRRINYKWLDKWEYNHRLGWECFKNLVQSIKELLNKGKINPVVFPVVQLDIVKRQTYHGTSLNQLGEIYDQWMDKGPTHMPREVICADLY